MNKKPPAKIFPSTLAIQGFSKYLKASPIVISLKDFGKVSFFTSNAGFWKTFKSIPAQNTVPSASSKTHQISS